MLTNILWQIERQGGILWPQVMVRIRKILKIKNKHVILESAFLWVSATADSANSDPNSVDSDPTRPIKYKLGHPSRVASRLSSAEGQLDQLGQLGLGLGWFLKHCCRPYTLLYLHFSYLFFGKVIQVLTHYFGSVVIRQSLFFSHFLTKPLDPR